MRDFSCFGESGVQIADSSSPGQSTNGSAVTCVYRTWLVHGDRRGGESRMTVVWSKTVLGQVGISISIADYAAHKKQQLSLLDIKLKWKPKGSKSTHCGPTLQLHVFWDFSAAQFGLGPGPEPSGGFYVAIMSDLKMVLLLGDLAEEAYHITGASNPSPTPGPSSVCVAKKQHISGNKVYTARACFCDGGRWHDIAIECECDASPSSSSSKAKEPCLEIRIDRKRVMQVKRLPWKFRGNQTIMVDDAPVEVLWDVHSWLFGAGAGARTNAAVFMFYTAPGTATMPEAHLGFSLLLYACKVQ
ncbi:hypothetical protein FCM35_KLT02449 [Carex littledalei]|uniref:Uncharacterized protein n=1 Tax=Carex littledalei TaxID=544730 RepID=A0A833R7B3_9POAL|nr:hypothetical protein FCM35_KLT02449 [Carex littledalei]